MTDREERIAAVKEELEAQGESVEEFDHDDPRFEDQGEEGDMSEGDEGELP